MQTNTKMFIRFSLIVIVATVFAVLFTRCNDTVKPINKDKPVVVLPEEVDYNKAYTESLRVRGWLRRPHLSEVKTIDGWEKAVNEDGSLRLNGPHITNKPRYWYKGKEIEVEDIQPTYLVGAAVNPVKVVYPGNPSDIGSKTDRKSNQLFSIFGVYSINQGGVGDCYYLAVLDAYDSVAPWFLRTVVRNEPDGFRSVEFRRDKNNPVRVVQDSVYGNSFARPSSDGAIVGLVCEKAYAYYRTGANTYASLNSGWTGSVMTDFGCINTSFVTSGNSNTLLATMAAPLSQGRPVAIITVPTPPSGSPFIGGHAYSIISVDVANSKVTVRNPWGYPGTTSGNSTQVPGLPGVFVVTIGQIQNSCSMGSILTGWPVDVQQPDYTGPWFITGGDVVGLADATVLANNWQKQVTPMTGGDMNGDGKVTALDLTIFQGHWQERRK